MDPKKTDSLAAAAAALPVVKTTALPSNGQVRCSIVSRFGLAGGEFLVVVYHQQQPSWRNNRPSCVLLNVWRAKDVCWCCCCVSFFIVAHCCCCARWRYSSSSSSLGVLWRGGDSLIISTVLCLHLTTPASTTRLRKYIELAVYTHFFLGTKHSKLVSDILAF